MCKILALLHQNGADCPVMGLQMKCKAGVARLTHSTPPLCPLLQAGGLPLQVYEENCRYLHVLMPAVVFATACRQCR